MLLSLKRSSLSLFAILGILFLILISSLYFFFRPEPNITKLDFESAKATLSFHVSECLESLAKQAVIRYGISSSMEIESYILENLDLCIVLSEFENRGFKISKGTIGVEVMQLDDTIMFMLDYPIMLVKKGHESSLQQFSYVLRKTVYADTSSLVEGTINLASDTSAILSIGKNTQVRDVEGNTIREVSMKLDDSEHENVVGGLVYALQPSGAVLSHPAKLHIGYPRELIPKGVPEESLEVAWYDSGDNIWRGVPTEVNTDTMTVAGEISHLGVYGVVFNRPPAVDSCIKAPLTIVLYGDSITDEHSRKGDLASALQSRGIDAQVFIVGHPGQNVYDEDGSLRSDFQDRVLSLNPDIVLLWWGMNVGPDPSRHEWQLAAYRKIAESVPVTIIVTPVPVCSLDYYQVCVGVGYKCIQTIEGICDQDQVLDMNEKNPSLDILSTSMESLGFLTVDVRKRLKQEISAVGCCDVFFDGLDGIHPNEAAHKIVDEEIAGFISEHLC